MEQIQLSNIADIVSGYAIPSADMVEEGTPIIKITNIKEDGSLDLENTAKYNKPITPKLQKFILKDKDVVVCMTGATIGKVARILKADQEYIVNQRVCIIRAKDSRLQDFVYHTLTLPTFRKYVEVVGYGAAQPNISASSIGKYRIQSSNELPTQQKIASVLSTYDTLIENNTKRIRLLEQMAENLYKEWFVRFRFPGYENVEMENGLPKGWKIGKIQDICNVTDGVHNTIIDTPQTNYLLLSCKNIKNGQLVIGPNERTIDKATFLKLRKRTKLAQGDILMSSVGTIGETYLLSEEPSYFEFQRSVAIIKPNKEYINSCLLYEMFKSMRTDFVNAAHGAAQQCLFIGDINNMKVCIPPLHLCNKFEAKVRPIYDTIHSVRKQSSLLSRQRDLLLPRLMSGKLEVKQTKS